MKIAGYLRALVLLVTPSLILLAVAVLITGCGGGTALTKAASAGRTDEVMALLEKGADVNEKPFICEDGLLAISGKGTALSCAAYKGHTAIVKLLLDRGVDVNTKDESNGATALVYAAWQGHTSTAKLLIEKGADVDDAMACLEKFGQNNDGFKGGFKFLERLAGKQVPSKQAETLAAKPSQDAYPAVRSDVDELPTIKVTLNKKSYAIVIGIEQYRQKLPPASYATKDAQRVSEYLTKVLGYPEENVITLTNDRAGLSDFAKYFEKWLPNNVESGATVFVYYSGHGAPNTKTGDAYLVPYDGDPSFIEETGYSLNRMYVALGKLPAGEIIVALDSCFSGAGGRSVIAKGSRPLVMNLQSNTALPKNMTVLSASSGDQTSSTYDEKGHGLFTYFMLKGIKNEDVARADGSLKIDDLYGYIKPQVERIARKQYNNEQSPQLLEARQNQATDAPVHAD